MIWISVDKDHVVACVFPFTSIFVVSHSNEPLFAGCVDPDQSELQKHAFQACNLHEQYVASLSIDGQWKNVT